MQVTPIEALQQLEALAITRPVTVPQQPVSDTSSIEEEDADTVVLTPALLDSIVRQTEDFSRELIRRFEAAGIPADSLATLQLEKGGIIHAANTYARKIDELFANDPKLAEEANTIIMLNTLEAMQEAARMYQRERAEAATDRERNEVQARYEAHLAEINELSTTLRLRDETVSSAALDYIRSEPQ